MAMMSIGDGVRAFQLSRQNASLKSDLGRLAAELSSGQVADRAKAAGGRTSPLSGIEHSLTILSGYEQSTRETGQLLGSVQRILASVDTQISALSSDLLAVTRDSSDSQIALAGQSAIEAFDSIVTKFNSKIGDRSLFAGAGVDGSALASAGDIVTALQTATAGDTTAAQMTASIDAWFDDPAGFASLGYLGDSGPTTKRSLSASDTVALDFRADSKEIKDVLKAAATAALAGADPGMTRSMKTGLLASGGLALQGAAVAMTQIQARVGLAESEVIRVGVEQATELTVLLESKNAYVAADPFDTATRLQAMQTQLETHYAMTSRLSRLSLAAYL